MVTLARPDWIPADDAQQTFPFRSQATLLQDAADLLDRLPVPCDSQPAPSLEELDAIALAELVDEDPIDEAVSELAEFVCSQTAATDQVFAMSLW